MPNLLHYGRKQSCNSNRPPPFLTLLWQRSHTASPGFHQTGINHSSQNLWIYSALYIPGPGNCLQVAFSLSFLAHNMPAAAGDDVCVNSIESAFRICIVDFLSKALVRPSSDRLFQNFRARRTHSSFPIQSFAECSIANILSFISVASLFSWNSLTSLHTAYGLPKSDPESHCSNVRRCVYVST